ncbi:MAG: response regulator receiver protein [uncultured bacterium]|nr:MAG: response regulator receiver protein [uncultured bacterium]
MVTRRGDMSAFLADFKAELSSVEPLVFWVLVTWFLVLTGPFGTYAAFSFWQRWLVVLPFMACVGLVCTTIRVISFRRLPLRSFRMSALVAAVLSCIVVAPASQQLLLVLTPDAKPSHPSLPELVLLVASLSFAMSSVRQLAEPMWFADMPQSLLPEPVTEPQVRLLQRLEPDLRGDLWAISVRDHYVDIQTSLGASSILLRFGDAMAEADAVEGAQLHRSHWVAWAAVDAVERDGAKLFVRLKHGARVPVSKNHRVKLEARGLI